MGNGDGDPASGGLTPVLVAGVGACWRQRGHTVAGVVGARPRFSWRREGRGEPQKTTKRTE
jgi:hypothetical protein